jgi:prevent-host-death family protein
MKNVPVRAAKAKFSEILHEAEAGETIIISRHRHPVAMIVPYQAALGNAELSFADTLLSIPRGFKISRPPPSEH